MGRYKELVADYKQKAKRKWELLKKQRKTRRGLPTKEQWELLKQDRAKRLAWKKRVKNIQDPREHYAQKKGYKYYRKLQHRKYKWGITIAVIVLLGGVFTNWYITATKPLTAEQKDARNHSLTVAQQVMDEGMVLLKNNNNTLPLKDMNVNVFGAGAASPIYSGGGAGGISSATAESLFSALKNADISYNPDLYNVYSNFVNKKKVSTDEYKTPNKSLLDILLPNIAGFLAKAPAELDATQLPEKVVNDAVKHSNTAIYVISRAGTETVDFKPEELKLTDNERGTLALLNDKFAHIVVLLNTTNVMELGFINEFSHIDSALWIGGPGEIGMRSVAAALKGDISPSGKLTDTYVYDIAKDPAVLNTGNFQYKDEAGEPVRRYFVNYEEGIYVGYRYYETFVADADYDKVVQYPFGYGLSYTTFDWKVGATNVASDTISAQVTVTNTGNRAGKDVVQVYYKAPYQWAGTEKPTTQLVTYAKTNELQPGESQTLTVTFTPQDMASYDERLAQAWVLDPGVYTIQLSRDVHHPVSSFDYTVAERTIFDKDTATGTEIENHFDHARDSSLALLSRANPEKSKVQAPQGDMFKLPASVIGQDYHHKDSNAAEPTTKAKNNMKLVDLKGLEYDDPKWQQFLDQLSAEEMIRLTGHGGYWSVAIDRLGVPRTSMYDGPSSIRNFLGSWASVAYPIPANLSATWNQELAETVGSAMGKEAQSFNVDAAYAPSLNMHRSPLGGRNFEYYSEDPLLAGKTGAAVVRGMQNAGTIAIIKHFVANDQETNRANFGLYTWTNEQTLREIYLKPFEIAVKEGDAHGVMSAFNRVGAIWAGGDKDLLTSVLRDEWGFKGFVITDAGLVGQGDHFDALQALEAGNDLMLASPFDSGQNTFEKQLKDYLKKDRAGTITALRNGSHNILYYVLQTGKL